MNDLNLRSNVRVLNASIQGSGKEVIVFEDHRYTLIALWHAFEKGLLDRLDPPSLIRFDFHDDGKDPKCGFDKVEEIRRTQPPLREFMDFVEWELSSSDDDWVKTAMELGLIGDMVIFGAEKTSNFRETWQQYPDHTGVRHTVWSLGHLWGLFGYQGTFTDLCQRERYDDLWKIFGWNGKSFFREDEAKSIVLDIDLDCFTGNFADVQQAFPDSILRRHFAQFQEVTSAGAFLKMVAQRSNFITVAVESDCCGGIVEAHKVMASLDTILFDRPGIL